MGENGRKHSRGLRASQTTTVTQSVLEGADKSVEQIGSLTITASHSRLVVCAVSGNVTCVLVTRGTGAGRVSTDGSTCPQGGAR